MAPKRVVRLGSARHTEVCFCARRRAGDPATPCHEVFPGRRWPGAHDVGMRRRDDHVSQHGSGQRVANGHVKRVHRDIAKVTVHERLLLVDDDSQRTDGDRLVWLSGDDDVLSINRQGRDLRAAADRSAAALAFGARPGHQEVGRDGVA